MPSSETGLGEELLAGVIAVEDPVTNSGDFLHPLVALESRLHIIDVFEPLVFLEGLDLFHQLLLLFFGVRNCGETGIDSEFENINGREVADLDPNWLKVFVASSDFFMLLEATVLENAEKGIGLVQGCTSAVNNREHLEPVNVYLIFSLVFLSILEGRREQSLA